MRNLSKWDFYAQLKTEFIQRALHHNLENKRFKVTALIVYFVSMFSLLSQAQPAKAQAGARDIAPLLVGQRVPTEFWQKEHLFLINGDTVRKNLNHLKGKTILLDFWATWCTACLVQQNDIQRFVDKYPEKLELVRVNPLSTKDNLEKISHVIDKHTKAENNLTPNSFATIIYDTYLKDLFPNYGFPYYVWINRSGVVQISTFRNLLDEKFVAPFID